MNEEDYIQLGAHLVALDPIVDSFCVRHGFERIIVGRYPRIRLVKDGPVVMWLELALGLDAEGRRFTRFEPDLPYDLRAGAYLDEADEEGPVHLHRCFQLWKAKPFHEVGPELETTLESIMAIIGEWDADILRADGRKFVPPDS